MKRLSPILFAILLSFSACVAVQYRGLIVENDPVKSSRRIKKEFYYNRALEEHSKLYSVNQTILKEIMSNAEPTYTFYDKLSLSSDSYSIENKMYIILPNEIIPIQIEDQETDLLTKISEDTGSIKTSDSTSVTVVTGYSQSDRKIIKIKYKVDPDIIEKMVNSDEIKFRYYAGPNMITIRLRGSELGKLKKLIEME